MGDDYISGNKYGLSTAGIEMLSEVAEACGLVGQPYTQLHCTVCMCVHVHTNAYIFMSVCICMRVQELTCLRVPVCVCGVCGGHPVALPHIGRRSCGFPCSVQLI